MKKRTIWIMLLGMAFLGGCIRPIYEPIPDEECEGCPLTSKKQAAAKPEGPATQDKREAVDFGAPLTLEQTVEFGLRNNLTQRIGKMELMSADKSSFEQKIEAISESEKNPEKRRISAKSNLSRTWRLIDAALVHARAKNPKTSERFLSERCGQKTAMDISETFRHASAIANALAYVNSIKEKDSENGELNNIITKLEADYSKLKGRLAFLTGLDRRGNVVFYHPPLLPLAAQLPGIDTFDVNSLEEQAMKNRPELYESGAHVLIQKEEARAAIRSITPDIEFFDPGRYKMNRSILADAWDKTGISIVRRLVDLPDKNESASRQHLFVAAGVIAQMHIALSDYAIKKDRFTLLEQACQRAEATGPPLEKMAAKLRLGEAAADYLAAFHRLCGSIGLDQMKCGDTFTR